MLRPAARSPARELHRARPRCNVRTQGAQPTWPANPNSPSATRSPGYSLESLIGRGGMGEVFRALDGRLARAVALKVLAPELVEDEAFRERILRESQLAASIDHPNVIPIYAAGEADGHVYIAMRLVEGSDLRTVLRRDGRLDAGARGGAARAGRLGARRGARARARASRRQAEQRPDRRAAASRALLPRRLRHHDDGRRPRRGRALAAAARHARLRRARAGAGRSGRRAGGRVLARMPRSSSASRARCRSSATPTSRSSSRTSRSRRRRPSERLPELPPELDAVIARALAKEPDARQASCGELVDEVRGALAAGRASAARGAGVSPRSRSWPACSLAGADRVGRPLRSAPAPALPETGSVVRIDPATGTVKERYPPVGASVGGRARTARLGRRLPPGDALADRSGAPATPTASRRSAIPARSRSSAGASTSAATAPRCSGATSRATTRSPAGASTARRRSCPAASPPDSGSSTRRAAPTCSGSARARRSRSSATTTIPLPDPPRRRAPAQLAVRHGHRRGSRLGDRRRARPPPLQDRAAQRPPARHATPLPITPQRIAAGAGAVWITDALHDVLVKVDPASGRIVQRIATGTRHRRRRSRRGQRLGRERARRPGRCASIRRRAASSRASTWARGSASWRRGRTRSG